jgi:hypothetical protein
MEKQCRTKEREHLLALTGLLLSFKSEAREKRSSLWRFSKEE